ncbi:MAG TPA: general secretion pathway protein GspB [Candidatus Competibacter sp.]|nr:general secretion pathway protein GspB [Candidatus Competibacteraceae bacterium]HRW65560.1 general secretion pathway protein GspB [Candidatus Competibacter sp.]
MSYILDALRKAEQERHLGQAPTLTTAPPLAEPTRNRRFWYGMTVLALGLNALLLAFFLGRSQPAPQPASVAAPAVAVPAATPAPRSPPSTSAASEKDGAPAVSSKEPVGQTVEPEAALPTVAPASRERHQKPARPTVTPGSVTIAPVPELTPPETLSAADRRGMPALNLDIHIYSADPDKRFVVINGRHYREGERLSEGPVLESVVRDGAILRQDGRRFHLSVRH